MSADRMCSMGSPEEQRSRSLAGRGKTVRQRQADFWRQLGMAYREERGFDGHRHCGQRAQVMQENLWFEKTRAVFRRLFSNL